MGNTPSTQSTVAALKSAVTPTVEKDESASVFRRHGDVFAALLLKAASAAPPSNASANLRSVRVFVSGGSDFSREKDALHAHVLPLVLQFCQVLGVGVDVVDCAWNLSEPGLHNNEQAQRSLNAINEAFDDQHIPIFIALLGDKYGAPTLPTTIPSTDFFALRTHLLTLPQPTPSKVSQLLDVWYAPDDNALPVPVHRLRPVSTIFPAFSSPSADQQQRQEAEQLWNDVQVELARLLKSAGVTIAGKSLVDLEVSRGYELGAGLRRKDGLFCFQRTLLDLKRTATETPELSKTYIDLDFTTPSPQIAKDLTAEITRLRSKHRATRFYAIPWLPELGFAPETDKTHAAYLQSFVEDVAKLVCESILKQVGGAGSGVASGVDAEVAKHSQAVLAECAGFVGRAEVLEKVESEFLGRESGRALVVYGTSGIGKTAFMSKVAQRVYEIRPESAIVTRLVGTTADSLDSRSLLRSLCTEIVNIYGASELKDKVEFEAAISHEVAETTGELTLEEKLGNLEHWPPISYEGLKAGFEIALKLADELRPLVVIIDALDELASDDDATSLDWLPKVIPPFVKVILSTSPTTRTAKHPTLSILTTLYPPSLEFPHLELPYFTEDEVSLMIDSLATQSARVLQPSQKDALLGKCIALSLPLYIRAAWTLHARKWTSSTTVDVISRTVKAETVLGLLEDFFDGLEAKLGRYFVARALAYLTAAKQGLSVGEWEDLLSCDETVMNEVFKFQNMPIRRIPPIYVQRLLEELGDSVVQKHVYGVKAIFWAHQQFHRVAEDRYLEQGQSGKIHSAFSAYWESKYSHNPKQYHDLFGFAKNELRYCIDQSLLICGKPNARRISAIVWHQLQMGKSGFRVGTKTLQDISHLSTAVHAGLLWDVLASYRFAMGLEHAEDVIVQQLNDYYRFLLENAEVLLYDPNVLVPVAANLYAGSLVADEARKWILSNSPGLNWIEWVNRPTARGEPIVTLRGTDGGSATDVMMVTGRDSYDERLVLAGVRNFDNQPTVFLYDIEQIEAASVGGGKAKLLAKRYLNTDFGQDVIEHGVPLTVCYSRSGTLLAVAAARSILFLDGSDLELKKLGRDATLPDGDLITQLAWTAKDGCIVSASDGSQPGRIGLWDAGSLTLLKVVQANLNPRQPITSSFNTISFWDEGREQFVVLNVDELALDPDGTDCLQYIHNKPHSNPPPDSCARFAISFRGDYAILAEETGKGYLLIDMNAKRPVARLEMEVDKVRHISLSHDGKRVAVVPTDDKVIFIHGITEDSKPSKDGLNLYTYQLLGTILGIDPALSDGSQVACVFGRGGKTVLTDGEFGSVRVWNVNELGDHHIMRYTSTLAAAYQGVVPIKNSDTRYIGWAVNEANSVVSLSDKKASQTLQSTNVSGPRKQRRAGFSRKDCVTGIAAHPFKPIVATVTNNGNLTLLYAEQAFHEKGWTGALRSAFSKKNDGAYTVTFNVMREGGFISPSCVGFLNSTSAVISGVAEGSASEILSFAVGYEDGSVAVWDWNSGTSLSALVPTVTLKLGVGRITSITATNISSSRYLALTVEDQTILLWDGITSDASAVEVLVQPTAVTNNYISMAPGPKMKNRRSVTSIMSITGLLERNSDQPVPVAFSNTQEQLLATGEADGQVTIWNTEAKVKRSLLIHSNDILPAPVISIAWAVDDAALVSLTEDKRVAIHNTVTGNIVWIHDLWMVAPRVTCAAFGAVARELVVLDHEGGLTSVYLHGDWPTASNADVFSPIKDTIDSNHPVIRHKRAFPVAPEPEFAEFPLWGPDLTRKLVETRAVKNSRTAYQWEFSSGASTHGHVALIRLNDVLPRGTYEVVCNVEVNEEPTVPLKFLCWTTGDVDVVDPELDIVHGFSRLFPLEEQKQLLGKGTVTLRLGFLKTSCKLENCCIDLTRLPGDGEPISFGDVHFIPVDPSLYKPDYTPAADLADAFDHLSVDFDEYEHSQGRRNSHIGLSHIKDQLENSEFPELIINPFDYDFKDKTLFEPNVAGASSSGGEVMWEFGQEVDDELGDSFSGGDVVSNLQMYEQKKKPNRKTMRMSVMESIAGVKTNVSGAVGGLLSSAASALPGVSGVVGGQPRAKASPEDIAREMEEARRRGREQARMFEEAEEFKAAQAAKQREWMARKIEFEQDAKRKAMLMQMQKEAQYGGYITGSPTQMEFDEGDGFDLEGVDEDIKKEAERLMREMLREEMAHDLKEESDK